MFELLDNNSVGIRLEASREFRADVKVFSNPGRFDARIFRRLRGR